MKITHATRLLIAYTAALSIAAISWKTSVLAVCMIAMAQILLKAEEILGR